MQESQLYNLKLVSSNDIIDLVQSWENYLLNERRYSEHTVTNYMYDLISFFQFKSSYDGESVSFDLLKNCDIKDIRSFLADRKMNMIKNSSNTRVLSGISSFFNYLVEQNLLSSNILLEVKRPKMEKRLPHPAGFDDIIKIIEMNSEQNTWVSNRNAFLCILLYATGIRISEALNLKVSDFRNDHLVILGKGKKERLVPVMPIVFEFFDDYLDSCPYIRDKNKNSDESLFWGEKGGRLNRTFCVKLLQKFGYIVNSDSNITPHSLRHSFATHLIQNNANIRVVEEIMGHASLATTEKYTKLVTEDLIAAYDNFHPLSKKNGS